MRTTEVLYSIYQLPIEDDCVFREYDTVKRIKGKIEISSYNRVYRGIEWVEENYDVNDILNEMYEKFNCNKPNDYRARSMSMSDIIELKINNKVSRYFVDFIGFKCLNN